MVEEIVPFTSEYSYNMVTLMNDEDTKQYGLYSEESLLDKYHKAQGKPVKSKAKAQAEVKSETKTEAKSDTKAQTKTETKADAKAETKTEAKTGSKTEDKTQTTPESRGNNEQKEEA